MISGMNNIEEQVEADAPIVYDLVGRKIMNPVKVIYTYAAERSLFNKNKER